MPRQPRLDAPGLLHHVIARGVNRGKIFRDARDRTDFLGRLAKMLSWSGSRCFAWALMPNHFHLLIQSGVQRLGRLMQRILTGYAINFNLRHGRVGHLFQNRFKSILCQKDAYFQELVRYIHLNPFRAGLVQTLEELDAYPWTGHAVLMGRTQAPWQELDTTLSWWGQELQAARNCYRRFLSDSLAEPEPEYLERGTALRTVLGEGQRASLSDSREIRLLGDDDFASRVIAQAEAKEIYRRQVRPAGLTLDAICRDLCSELELPIEEALSRSKKPAVSRFRALAAYHAVDDLGWRAVDVARFLGVSEPSLSVARERGRVLCSDPSEMAMGSDGN